MASCAPGLPAHACTAGQTETCTHTRALLVPSAILATLLDGPCCGLSTAPTTHSSTYTCGRHTAQPARATTWASSQRQQLLLLSPRCRPGRHTISPTLQPAGYPLLSHPRLVRRPPQLRASRTQPQPADALPAAAQHTQDSLPPHALCCCCCHDACCDATQESMLLALGAALHASAYMQAAAHITWTGTDDAPQTPPAHACMPRAAAAAA